MTITTVNPSTHAIISTYGYMDDVTLDAMLQRGHRAYVSQWRDASLSARAQVVQQFAQHLEAHTDELATLMANEMGKCISEGRAEIAKSVAVLHAVAHRAREYFTIRRDADHALDHDGLDVCIDIRPIGGLLAVMPWNFPVWQIMRVLAPNVVGGNVVYLKHAAMVTGTAIRLGDLWHESGAPEGVFQTLVIDHDQVERVIATDHIQGVTLTGSVNAGRHVASIAARYGKKSVLELGGSDPFLITDDANLDEAVDALLKARFSNCGQVCTAAKRAIVHTAVYEDVCAKVVKGVQELTVGDPLDPDTQVGPMASMDQREQVLIQLARGVQAGGIVLSGGEAIERPGAWMAPTVVANVDQENPLAQEEIFGPVLAIMRAHDDAEMITLANATEFGLGATVFSGNTDHGIALARQIESGMVAINTQNLSHPIVPFGGTKASGYGRELGAWGATEFMNIRTVSVRR